MSKCGDSPLEAGHMPSNAPGTEHPWKAGSDVSCWSSSLILLMGVWRREKWKSNLVFCPIVPRKMKFSDGHRLVGRRTVCLLQSGLWGAWPWRVLAFSGSARESSWCIGETHLPALEMLVPRACGILVCSARIWEELDLKDEESPAGRCHNLGKRPWKN